MVAFDITGWRIFPAEPATRDWVARALPSARAAVKDPALRHWHQCEGTWFVGLDALPNDGAGRIADAQPLSGRAVDFVTEHWGWPELHRAQLSVTYPGYPRPRDGESEAAFRYRRDRDAAHVDGVIGVGSPKRRFVQEPHLFILGIALVNAPATAAPLVVWEGSHRIMQGAFHKLIHTVDSPEKVDVTDAYMAARKRCFEQCKRVELPLKAGEAVVLHRLALHGVAPWRQGAQAGPDGRMIAYFRPPMPGGAANWA